MNPDSFKSYQRKSQTQAGPNPLLLAGFSLKSSLQGQYLITRQPNSMWAALAHVLCYKQAWTRRWPGSKTEKQEYVNGKQRENRHRLPRLGGKRVGIKPTTSSWKNIPIFSESTFYPKMAGTFWCLTLFPPHLQITKLVSPISSGKEKEANRSHIQAVAAWTPQKLRLLQPQCLGLSVLPQKRQQAHTLH